MIKPLFSFENTDKFKFTEQFVDREEATRLFQNSLSETAGPDYHIIMYYGVGGIGKSKLKAKTIDVHRQLYEENAVEFFLDFNVAESRSPVSGLLRLVDSCWNERKLKFDCFELAYALYFRKKYPDIAYDREKENLTSKFQIGFDIISIFDNGITESSIAVIETFFRKIKNHRIDPKIKEDLKTFDSLSIHEIEEKLPAYFAYDLEEQRKKYQDLNVVFYIDTFEALNIKEEDEIHRSRNERWIQNLILLFPGTLFTIFGRDKIHWDSEWSQYIRAYQLKDFGPACSREFLKLAGVREDAVISKISDICHGYPFYLSLALRTYGNIVNSGKIPKPEDFGDSYSEIIERFVYNLGSNEIDLLKIMSIPRYYTKPIFELLVRRFIPGYPLTRFQLFNTYSFLSCENGRYFLHALMKQGLQKYISAETAADVHRAMLEYYEGLFSERAAPDLFLEMIYHKSRLCEAPEFHAWMRAAPMQTTPLKYLLELQRQGEQQMILNAISQLKDRYGISGLGIDLLNVYVDAVHLGGDYKGAVAICERYLSRYQIQQICSDGKLLKIEVRKLHHSMFWQPVNGLIADALRLESQNGIREFHDEYGELLFLIGGNLGMLAGDFLFCQKWLEKTFRYARQNDMGDLELRAARKWIDLLAVNGKTDEALAYSKNYISADAPLKTRYHIYLLGALGETFRQKGWPEKARYCFTRLEREAAVHHMPGWQAHSYLGQALLAVTEGDRESAEDYNRKAERLYSEIDQTWGILNVQTIDFFLARRFGEIETGSLRGKMEKTLGLARKMNYFYHIRVMNDLMENKEPENFRLLFL